MDLLAEFPPGPTSITARAGWLISDDHCIACRPAAILGALAVKELVSLGFDRGRYDLPVTTREKAHALLDELSDAELDEVVRLIEVRHEERAEPEMAELPEAWKTFEDGSPVPNWVAAVDEARKGR